MTPKVARLLIEYLVDRPFKDHYAKLDTGCSVRPCVHEESGSLNVARVLESGFTLGKRRAHLDVPDDSEMVKVLVGRMVMFTDTFRWSQPTKYASRSVGAIRKMAKDLLKWSNRTPLERLAEAGIDLD